MYSLKSLRQRAEVTTSKPQQQGSDQRWSSSALKHAVNQGLSFWSYGRLLSLTLADSNEHDCQRLLTVFPNVNADDSERWSLGTTNRLFWRWKLHQRQPMNLDHTTIGMLRSSHKKNRHCHTVECPWCYGISERPEGSVELWIKSRPSVGHRSESHTSWIVSGSEIGWPR